MRTYAPIVVFAFNRLQHLSRSLESLSSCPEARHSALTVYCDGPRKPEDNAAVAAVRAYASTLKGFASLEVVARERNLGLAKSIIGGVTEQLKKTDRVIVLEDDLLVSPHFLRYMNDGLDFYQNDERVASIHGYTYPTDVPLPETFFIRGADCWGWATWSRAWAHFNSDGAHLLDELRSRGLVKDFDFDGNFAYTRMLENQIRGKNNSWAIRWHASCYLKDLLTLYPGQSLIEHIGFDASGTHCGSHNDYSRPLAKVPIAVGEIPIAPSREGRAAFIRFFRRRRSITAVGRRLLNRLIPNRLGRENI